MAGFTPYSEFIGECSNQILVREFLAGFTPYPLSSLVNATIRSLLENFFDKYGLEETDGALYLGWMNRALVVSSAWR